jgi:sarcosine oxidase
LKKFDAIVVGCGIYGSSTSYHLASKGLKTLTLEKFMLNHSYGSSHGRTRIIRTAYTESPLYVPIVKRALQLWFELQNLSQESIIRLTGGLQVGPPNGSLIVGASRSAREYEIEHEILPAKEIQDRFPVFSPVEGSVGMYEKDAGVLFAEECVKAYVKLAEEEGGLFTFSEPMVRWAVAEREHGFVVTTAKEEYEANSLILTSGSWTRELVPDLGLPLEIERQTVFWMNPKEPSHFLSADQMPIFIFEESGPGLSSSLFYGTPDVGDGIKAGKHHGGAILQKPDEVKREVTKEDEMSIRAFLEKRIPVANGTVASSTTCIYTNTPDGNFIVDSHPKHKNLWIVSACSGHGFKFASAIGEIIAQEILEEKSQFDLAAFKLNRFTTENRN